MCQQNSTYSSAAQCALSSQRRGQTGSCMSQGRHCPLTLVLCCENWGADAAQGMAAHSCDHYYPSHTLAAAHRIPRGSCSLATAFVLHCMPHATMPAKAQPETLLPEDACAALVAAPPLEAQGPCEEGTSPHAGPNRAQARVVPRAAWRTLDSIDLEEVFRRGARIVKERPRWFRGGLKRAFRMSLRDWRSTKSASA